MKEQRSQECPEQQGMYDPSFEHDNCGIGAVVNIKGIKSHKTVEDALSIVENLHDVPGSPRCVRHRGEPGTSCR